MGGFTTYAGSAGVLHLAVVMRASRANLLYNLEASDIQPQVKSVRPLNCGVAASFRFATAACV